MIAHEYKHYNLGGTGLRSLLDTYVFLLSNDLDMKYVGAETEKLGITTYDRVNRRLAQKLFSKDGRQLTEEEEKMLDYIISSGTYGTFEHVIRNTGGRFKYFIRRIFGPIGKNDPAGSTSRRHTPHSLNIRYCSLSFRSIDCSGR